MNIDVALVARLIKTQFPQWADLPIRPVTLSGWDNRTFHLGDEMSVRLPSAEMYARAVHNEQTWLPRLAPQLPLPIPHPIAMGEPDPTYPWHWSVYRWLPGEIVKRERIDDLGCFAADLAAFLRVLQSIDPTGGPSRKLRGGSLSLWQPQVEEAQAILAEHVAFDVQAAAEIWQAAIQAPFDDTPVWYHGDVAAGNLLTVDGKLTAVIDFGGLGVGDPACDMTIAWTFLDAASRQVFRESLAVSDAIWQRGRGWALWKAMIVVAGLIETNVIEAASSQYALDQLLEDHKAGG